MEERVDEKEKAPSCIGTLNEKPLHEALKKWYAREGDRFEERVDGYIIDIVRGDLLVEIQTRNLGALRRKLEKLTLSHPVRLVHPIALEKWIVKRADNGIAGRRRSPRRGGFENVFAELVGLPVLMLNANFSLELLLVREEEEREYQSGRAWRRHGWVTRERRLLGVEQSRVLSSPADLKAFLPAALADPFTAADLAAAINRPRRLAQQMVYCLRLTGCLAMAGKQGRAVLYNRSSF